MPSVTVARPYWFRFAQPLRVLPCCAAALRRSFAGVAPNGATLMKGVPVNRSNVGSSGRGAPLAMEDPPGVDTAAEEARSRRAADLQSVLANLEGSLAHTGALKE